MRTAEFIRVLPKAELHLHLEGAVPWAMARAHSAPSLPERPPWYAEGFRFDDFLEFRGAIRECMSCLVDAPAYGAAAGAIFRGLQAQNVRYAEISFDVVRALDLRLEIADVVAAVKAAEPPGLITRVFHNDYLTTPLRFVSLVFDFMKATKPQRSDPARLRRGLRAGPRSAA